jgi:hypothetical protein
VSCFRIGGHGAELMPDQMRWLKAGSKGHAAQEYQCQAGRES